MNDLEIVPYQDSVPYTDKLRRGIWHIFYLILFKPFSINVFNAWRVGLLKMFGAKISKGCIVYSSCYIPAPWRLTLGQQTCLGPGVKLHFGDTIIGNKVTISQRTYLCSASHDISSLNTPLVIGKIIIKDFVWVAAECFIGMNVTINEGAVVGARSAVFKDIEAWKVVGGNPSKVLKERYINDK